MTAKVLYIKPSPKGTTYLLGLRTDTGDERYRIPSRLYHELGEPCRGYTLTDGELDMIFRADEEGRAMKKALSLLSYSDSSQRNMVMKLRRAGYSSDVAKETAEEMVRLGYIDESRQLFHLVEKEANDALFGPSRIVAKLSAKGYSASDVRRALDILVSDGTVDIDNNRRRLLEKKLSDDATAEDRKKLLYKYGYKL